MRAGDLRDRIRLCRKVRVHDGQGGYKEEEQVVLSRMAKVEIPGAKDGIVAGRDMVIRTHDVTIRYSSVPEIGDVVLWKEERLSVLATRPIERGRGLVLECETEGRPLCTATM